MAFPFVILDECCQMTEPNALLPIARSRGLHTSALMTRNRFSCSRLMLVGDPKQLDPTITGSESEHSLGLEQTLFDRCVSTRSLCPIDHPPDSVRPARSPSSSAPSTAATRPSQLLPMICSTKAGLSRLFGLLVSLILANQIVDGVTEAQRSPLAPQLQALQFINVQPGQVLHW